MSLKDTRPAHQGIVTGGEASTPAESTNDPIADVPAKPEVAHEPIADVKAPPTEPIADVKAPTEPIADAKAPAEPAAKPAADARKKKMKKRNNKLYDIRNKFT